MIRVKASGESHVLVSKLVYQSLLLSERQDIVRVHVSGMVVKATQQVDSNTRIVHCSPLMSTPGNGGVCLSLDRLIVELNKKKPFTSRESLCPNILESIE